MADSRSSELLVNYAGDDGFSVIDDSRHKRRNFQIAGTVLYRYVVDGIALAALEARCIPDVIPQPAKEMVNASLILLTITAADMLNLLTRRKHPFAGVKISDPAKYGLAMLVPLATTVAIGFSIQAFGGAGNSTHINSTGMADFIGKPGPAAPEVQLIVNNPLLHNALTGLLYYAQYGGIKYLLDDCCVDPKKPDERDEEGRENICNFANVLQGSLKVVTDVIEPIAMYEALRMILIETGKEAALHNRFFPLAIIGIDQALKLWGHMSQVPRPLNDLIPKNERYASADYINELLNSNGNYSSEPSKATVATYMGIHLLRSVLAVTAGGWAALEILNYARGQSDQEQLDARDRMINLIAITYATGLAEQTFDLTWKAGGFIWSKVSNCCSSMFGSNRGYQPVETQVEDVLGDDNPFKYSS